MSYGEVWESQKQPFSESAADERGTPGEHRVPGLLEQREVPVATSVMTIIKHKKGCLGGSVG